MLCKSTASLGLLALAVGCGSSRFSAETPVAPLQPRNTAYLEGTRVPAGVPREAFVDEIELISGKDRSVCFRASVRQTGAEDVPSGQWEAEVNDDKVVLGKEVVTIRDYALSGGPVTVRAQGVPGAQVANLALPHVMANTVRVFERQVAFCRGFVDGIPEEVEVELTLNRQGARDMDVTMKWQLRAL